MEVSLVRPSKNIEKHYVFEGVASKTIKKPFVFLDFLGQNESLALPWPAPQTDVMWDSFGDRLGDRLGVVWRPESDANQPKHTTSNQMQPTSIAIQTIATQSTVI